MSKKRARKPEHVAEMLSLESVLAKLEITSWDFLIIGDGSGSNWGKECGWAAVSIERSTGQRIPWYGFVNRGSVNFAEVMAFIQPLTYITNREIDRVSVGGKRKAIQVHLITDSDYAKGVGSSEKLDFAKNGVLWEQLRFFNRVGVILNWHWINRNTIDLHAYVDGLSKLARNSFKQYNLSEETLSCEQGKTFSSVYDVNPDESGEKEGGRSDR